MKLQRFPFIALLAIQAACGSDEKPDDEPWASFPPGGDGTVTFSVDGKERSYRGDAAGMLDEAHGLTMIKAAVGDGDASSYIFLAVESLEPGTYPARGNYVLVELTDDGSKWRSFDAATITVNRIGGVGEPISGSFEAWVSANGDEEPKRLVAGGTFEVVRVAKR